MKKLMALILTGILLLSSAAMAAEWAEGLSPSKPYTKSSPVDLTESMGYVILYPTPKLPVATFCDVLEMYLPREDLIRGAGKMTIYEVIPGQEDKVHCVVDFADPHSVGFRKLSEVELQGVMWGGGMCVEIHLAKSLEFGDRQHSYYVLMEPGCFAANGGSVKSISITAHDAWTPIISGEYGISGLYYVDAPYMPKALGTPEPEMLPNAGMNNVIADEPEPEPEVTATPEPVVENNVIGGYAPVVEGVDGGTIQSVGGGFLGADDDTDDDSAGGGFLGADGGMGVGAMLGADDDSAGGAMLGADAAPAMAEPDATPEPTPIPDADAETYVVRPDAGDIVRFDLVLGGDAAMAIPYSENGSVEFDTVEYRQSTSVAGRVIKDKVQWGIVFLSESGDIVNSILLSN